MNKIKLVSSSAFSAIITIVFVVVITVWAELSVPLKDWLKSVSGHHWTTKSIFSVLLYVSATLLLYKLQDETGRHLHTALKLLLVSTGLGVLALTAFYTGHHLGIF